MTLPRTDIEQLIFCLYNSSDNTEVLRAQKQLQDVQRSEDGWQMARHLLASPDPQLQFFGALTLTVKINALPVIDEATAYPLITEILSFVVLGTRSGSSTPLFVLRKIFSTLSLIYTKNPSIMQSPVSSVVVTLVKQKVEVNPMLQPEQLRETSYPQTVLIPFYLFCQILAEDAARTDSPAAIKSQIHKNLMAKDLPLVSYFLEQVFVAPNHQMMTEDLALQLVLQSIDCFSSWLAYAAAAKNDIPSLDVSTLTDLLPHFVRNILTSSNADVSHKSVETLTDLFNVNANLLTIASSHRSVIQDILFKSWGINHVRSLLQIVKTDSDAAPDAIEELQDLGKLYIAFTENNLMQLINDTAQAAIEGEHSQLNHVLDLLLEFTVVPGIPIVDETISRDFIEFWCNLADTILMDSQRLITMFGANKAASFRAEMSTVLLKVMESYWWKIRLVPLAVPGPSRDMFMKELQYEFLSYRRDVGDLLEAVYPVLGLDIYKLLGGIPIRVLKNADQLTPDQWLDIEASLFCLHTLADNFDEDSTDGTDVLRDIFSSDLLMRLSKLETTDIFHIKILQTAIKLVAGSDFFLKKYAASEYGKVFLGNALTFLFEMLPHTSISLACSKAVKDLCFECRVYLIPFFEGFLTVLQSLFGGIEGFVTSVSTGARNEDELAIDLIVKERTIGAVSAVVQALSTTDLDSSIDYLSSLVNSTIVPFAEAVSSRLSSPVAVQSDNHAPIEVQIKMCVMSVLNCLTELGKGLQCPHDVSQKSSTSPDERWKLYWDYSPYSTEGIDENSVNSSILRDRRAQINRMREIILHMVNYFALESHKYLADPEITEKSCEVLSVGLKELEPGLFVFRDPMIILNFIEAKMAQLDHFKDTSITPLASLAEQVVGAHSGKKLKYNTSCRDPLNSSALGLILNAFLFRRLGEQVLSQLANPDLSERLDVTLASPDPSYNEAVLRLLKKLITEYLEIIVFMPETLLGQKAVDYILMISTGLLKAKERPVVKAAASLLVTFIDKNTDDEASSAERLYFVEKYGLRITRTVIQLISGAGARSELDFHADVLKKLMMRCPAKSKGWLENSLLNGHEVAHTQRKSSRREVAEADRRRLYLQLVQLGGSRKVNEVIKDYWLKASGIGSDYHNG